MLLTQPLALFFFFNDTATTEIYTLSLHDALPILIQCWHEAHPSQQKLSPAQDKRIASSAIATNKCLAASNKSNVGGIATRSEEHTSELQSHLNIVCRLLLDKKRQSDSTSIIPSES